METVDVKKLFTDYEALLTGHFLLSSGLHSDTYFQSALILQYPEVASKLAAALADKIKGAGIEIDLVVSPAMGGVIIGHETARALGVRAIFTERVDGKVMLRRGFNIKQGGGKTARVLIVEDVITTGLSTKEVIAAVTPLGASVAAVCSLVDRSGGNASFNVPQFSLLSLEVKSYDPSVCPLCKGGSAAIKPGSRK